MTGHQPAGSARLHTDGTLESTATFDPGTDLRGIRGIASADETMELLEEGIFVLPAPVPHEDEFH